MRGLTVRLTLILCVSVMAVVFLTGCPKKDIEEPEPDVTTAEPEPREEPAPPPPPPPVDPRAWYSEMNDVFFDFDKYELRSDARAVLQANATLLKDKDNWTLVLEGHCDERGTTDYNMALGERRAAAVLDYLSDLGVTASKVKTVSYGEERPFSTGSTESAWAQNRRVHFRFE